MDDTLSKQSKKKPPDEGGGDEWLVSYADLMSMLLAVFVVFFSMASLDESKAEKVSTAVSTYLTEKRSVKIAVDDDQSSTNRRYMLEELATILNLGSTKELSEKLQALKEDSSEVRSLKRTLKTMGIVGTSKLTTHRPSFDIELPVNMLFSSGSYQLKPGSGELLRKISQTIRKMVIKEGKVVQIVGHTDASPMRSKGAIRSAYSLSALRAESVLLKLKELGVQERAMTVVGAGSTKPLYPERLAGGVLDRAAQRKNRRVTIKVLKP